MWESVVTLIGDDSGNANEIGWKIKIARDFIPALFIWIIKMVEMKWCSNYYFHAYLSQSDDDTVRGNRIHYIIVIALW